MTPPTHNLLMTNRGFRPVRVIRSAKHTTDSTPPPPPFSICVYDESPLHTSGVQYNRDNTTVLIYVHGGAYVCGRADQFSKCFSQLMHKFRVLSAATVDRRDRDRDATATSSTTNLLRIYSIDYPLAPDVLNHTAPFESVWAAYQYIIKHESLLEEKDGGGVGGGGGGVRDRVFIGGDSAGGALAIGLARRIHESSSSSSSSSQQQPPILRPCGVILISPWVDAASDYTAGEDRHVQYDILTPAGLNRTARALFGSNGDDRTRWAADKDVCPLRHDDVITSLLSCSQVKTQETNGREDGSSGSEYRRVNRGVLVVYARHEIFAPDIQRFITRCKQLSAESSATTKGGSGSSSSSGSSSVVSVIEGNRNAIHDWLLLPDYFGREAQQAQTAMIEWMLGVKK